jgi:hypothetical protein
VQPDDGKELPGPVDLTRLERKLREVTDLLTRLHASEDDAPPILEPMLRQFGHGALVVIHRNAAQGGGSWEVEDASGRTVAKVTPPVFDAERWTYCVWDEAKGELE